MGIRVQNAVSTLRSTLIMSLERPMTLLMEVLSKKSQIPGIFVTIVGILILPKNSTKTNLGGI
jgi:hypothetical protein